MSEIVEQPKRTGLLIWLIVSQLLAVASLLPWFVATAMSLAAGGGEGLPIWMIPVLCYPIFLIAMIIGAWIAYKRRKNKLAAILSGLSFAPLALLFLVINLS